MKIMKQRSRISVALIIAVLVSGIFCGACSRQNDRQKSVYIKDQIRTIAVVNMDQGIIQDQNIVNYGASIITFPSEHFTSTSLEQARTGISEHRYAAYVVIPANFSEKVWSINSQPQKAVLEYAVNPNLEDAVTVDVVYELKAFEMKLNADISYLYLYSILDEFHNGQRSADVIMQHDKQDMEQLSAIEVASLIAPLAFAELQPMENYPKDIDLMDFYRHISTTMDELEKEFDDYIQGAETRLEEVRSEEDTVEDALDKFKTVVEELSLLDTESGEAVYKETRDNMIDRLNDLDAALSEEHEKLIVEFTWLKRRDRVASASNAASGSNAERYNIWLDMIYETSKKHKAEHMEELKRWRESFDYNRLLSFPEATPPNATPPNAIVLSNPIPSDAEEIDALVLNRDKNMYLAVANTAYDHMRQELDEMMLDADTRRNMEELVSRYFLDEDAAESMVASQSNAYPIGRYTEAGQYVAEFLDMVPVYDYSLNDILDEVEAEVKGYSDQQIEALSKGVMVPIEDFTKLYDDHLVIELEQQEIYLQQVLQDEAGDFKDSFDQFSKYLSEYEPLKDSDQDDFQSIQENLYDSMSSAEKKISDKTDADWALIQQMEENRDKDLSTMQNGINQSHELTAKNVTDTLEAAKKNRADLNSQNHELLWAFTQKLPYTSNGSVAATNTYDVLVNPVMTEEKEVSTNPAMVFSMAANLKKKSRVSVLLIMAVAVLLVCNGYLLRKNRYLKKIMQEEEQT